MLDKVGEVNHFQKKVTKCILGSAHIWDKGRRKGRNMV